MAADSAAYTPSAAKPFICNTVLFVDGIGRKFDEKEEVMSLPFHCPQDPTSPTFKIEVEFGVEESDHFSVFVHVVTDPFFVHMKMIKIIFFDHQWVALKTSQTHAEPKPRLASWGWPSFMSRDKLKPTEEFGLRIVVEVEYKGLALETMKPAARDRIVDFLDDEEFADVTFQVKEEKIKAHKVILAARSPYFESMFRSGMKESIANEVVIPDVDPDVFAKMLQFLYSGVAPLDTSEGLLVAADKYAVEDLKEICETTLVSRLNGENVAEFLLLAEKHNCPLLLEKASVLFRSHFYEIGGEDQMKLKSNPTLLWKLLKMSH